jgi:hypothetical protein
LNTISAHYDLKNLKAGYNRVDGEDIFYIREPGLGLWAYRGKL